MLSFVGNERRISSNLIVERYQTCSVLSRTFYLCSTRSYSF